MAYNKRIADSILRDKLDAMGAVLVEGPKACGKTTTAEQQAKSIIYIDDPERHEYYMSMAQTNIKHLLRGYTPLLLDEWQLVPQLWDAIRFEVDHRQEDGQFILTGSAVPADASKITHSGAGRFGWVTMRTMSLWEAGDSSGAISLADLFAKRGEVWAENSLSMERIAFLVCRGGWPKAILKKSEKAALLQVDEYFQAITRSDISRVDNVSRNAERAQQLMRSYARYQGSQTGVATILKDISNKDNSGMSDMTVESYLNALRKIFIVEDMPAWNPNLRSKTAIRSSNTRYFSDSSLASAALGIGPKDLMNDLKTLGLLFETMAVHDLRVYADAMDGKVYHYRDGNGLECDAVVHLRNGSYGLVEIKLGGETLIEEGAASLKKLADKIDTTKMKAPSFLMVLTAVGAYAYQRKDGVIVVPIGCLKD
ncbi:MAG: ATP-binding protein [Bacteroidales bacterium]|nr:ATP-binding protein [Bacteroidales bacterium]